MLRATQVARDDEDTVLEPRPAADAVHDPSLEEALQRLTAPPPPPPPATARRAARPADRAVYGLD